MTTAIALTIAGSDSSGGAGIQADLKTFSALGVYGASAITALTAQNTTGVQAVYPVPAEFVTAQIDSVMSDLTVDPGARRCSRTRRPRPGNW
jgi:hydroxymethylpyrimidine/phosphomethylpyrimidine kinase